MSDVGQTQPWPQGHAGYSTNAARPGIPTDTNGSKPWALAALAMGSLVPSFVSAEEGVWPCVLENPPPLVRWDFHSITPLGGGNTKSLQKSNANL